MADIGGRSSAFFQTPANTNEVMHARLSWRNALNNFTGCVRSRAEFRLDFVEPRPKYFAAYSSPSSLKKRIRNGPLSHLQDVPDNHIVGIADEIKLDSDQDAIKHAKTKLDGLDLEVWHGGRVGHPA